MSNRGRKFPPEPLTQDEVRRLLKACSNRAPTGVRNRALIVLLWRAGLRISEALALRPKDVDRASGTVRVLSGKGGRHRAVGLDPEAFAVLERWLDLRPSVDVGRSPIFCTITRGMAGNHVTRAGKRLSASYARAFMARLGRRAGIEKRVHPHGLRHTHAFELAQEGFPLHAIQAQLGHGSLATTDRYVRHLRPQDLIELVLARSWSPS